MSEADTRIAAALEVILDLDDRDPIEAVKRQLYEILAGPGTLCEAHGWVRLGTLERHLNEFHAGDAALRGGRA